MTRFTLSLRLEEIRLRHGITGVMGLFATLEVWEENASNSERSTSDSLGLKRGV